MQRITPSHHPNNRNRIYIVSPTLFANDLPQQNGCSYTAMRRLSPLGGLPSAGQRASSYTPGVGCINGVDIGGWLLHMQLVSWSQAVIHISYLSSTDHIALHAGLDAHVSANQFQPTMNRITPPTPPQQQKPSLHYLSNAFCK